MLNENSTTSLNFFIQTFIKILLNGCYDFTFPGSDDVISKGRSTDFVDLVGDPHY